MKQATKKSFSAAALAACVVLASFPAAAADGLPAALQAKVEKYKHKLVDWAANPTIVAAVKEANAKAGSVSMNNSKWLEVEDKSPTATAFSTSKAGALLTKWEEDQGINKLVLRDEKGNLVAASTKPLLYNNSVRPVYINGMKGQVWAASTILPDPTTQVKSVQASAPVFDGGKVIGVIHVGITE